MVTTVSRMQPAASEALIKYSPAAKPTASAEAQLNTPSKEAPWYSTGAVADVT